jgi:hypothetical protein
MLFGADGTEGTDNTVKESPVVGELRKLNVEAMTPIEALNVLADLKKKAEVK